jgi:Glutamine synthetase
MSTMEHDGSFGRITLAELRDLTDRGDVDTIMCAAPDPYGRLVGKRLTAPAFQRLAVEGDGVHASTFVFAVDLEMNPLELPVSNAENGYVDFRMVPDLATLRRVPWEPATAIVMCDAYLAETDELLPVAPRTILKRQIERAEAHDIRLKFASELEFFLARTPSADAHRAGYRGLEMLSSHRSDYNLLQSGRDEWFIRQVRNGLNDLGVPVESSKPEWGLGQQEITLDYADTLEMADRHMLFKHGVKELAHRAGLTCTFMAKPDIDEVGSSCHLHVSLWSASTGEPLSWSDADNGMSPLFGGFVAGQLGHALDLGLLFAPTINAYKRFLPGQFAGTAIGLGHDNRSFAFRLVGRGPSYRVENRIPGADVNPYYAYSATIAAGLEGIEKGYPTPPVRAGNAWEAADLPVMWSSMRQAVEAFGRSDLASRAFGPQVHAHLLASAQEEVKAFESNCVTDWELRRYYERV